MSQIPLSLSCLYLLPYSFEHKNLSSKGPKLLYDNVSGVRLSGHNNKLVGVPAPKVCRRICFGVISTLSTLKNCSNIARTAKHEGV